ncbi:ArgJ family-domain-containing protein [Naematelia encephala]|uniref:Arginine biosynthesis bifunctional protein ArgJ, mitochondrial n=1 Tax=Naematelia encephala TaxID=71784 RepID=A0A1Y2AUL7_9TREE|nr:ArgJ family-domain-containing protein [Naematelia encephala]
MPPPLPSSNASRLLPTLVRAFSSTSSAGSSAPTPSKQHHVKSYPASAFPFGFSVASTHSGIKKTGALDLGVLVSERPCAAAASVTRNVFKAAPVTVTTEVLEKGKGRVQGFVVNSGCANAVTGKKGLEDAWAMSRAVGEGVLVMSTGVIGQHLPIDGITGAIPKLKSTLASTPEAWLGLAKAFMTTDTFPKLRTKTITLGGKEVRLAGIDKGAGMIAPNMGPPHATLLGVVATDAAIAPEALQSALNYAVDRSFNSITVDGDVSTNDTILCLANGAVEGKELTTSDPEFEVFREELRSFAEELAQLVVRDGEGATKFVTVRVKNAPTFDVANAVARSVANSTLVKTAFYGQGEYLHCDLTDNRRKLGPHTLRSVSLHIPMVLTIQWLYGCTTRNHLSRQSLGVVAACTVSI